MAEYRNYIEAGLLVRGRVRRELRAGAIRAGVDIDIQEDKGLLESMISFRVTGREGPVSIFKTAFEKWARARKPLTFC